MPVSTASTHRAVAPRRLRLGWGISMIVILFLTLDTAIKLAAIGPVLETMTALGWPGDPATARALGLLLAAITLLYAWPRTAPLGVVLLTAYLGGAVATHVRIGSPLFTHSLFGVYIGALAWLGLYLRDARIRALIG